MKSLEQWLSILEHRHPVEIELGLDRISVVHNRLNIAQIAGKVLVVGGTNGKGSCVKALETLAIQHGMRVGTYTSPHILRYNERVRIQGKEVEDSYFCRAFEMIDANRGEVPLTYFEVGTLAAFLILSREDLDLAILEVGMGGRFDAVNIIDSDVSVITSIAVDHEHWLGSDREKIAMEKAGIARTGKPIVCADPDPPANLIKHLEQLNAVVYLLGNDFVYGVAENTLCFEVTGVDGEKIRYEHLPFTGLPVTSVIAALQAMELLGIRTDHNHLVSSLNGLQLSGRYQKIRFHQRNIILDVAHNPAAAAYLGDKLALESGPVFAVAALMSDKDIEGFVKALEKSVDHWYIGNLSNHKRALEASRFKTVLENREAPHSVMARIEDAFDEALLQLPAKGTLVVCGSFLTISAILKHTGIENGI